MPPKRKSLGTADPNVAPPPKKRGGGKANAPATSSASRPGPDNIEELVGEAIRDGRSSSRKHRWATVSASKNLDNDYLMMTKIRDHAFEFMCVCNPVKSFDDEEEDDEDGSESEGDEDDDDEDNPREDGEGGPSKKAQACDAGETCPCRKTAASLPSHKYTMTRAGIAKYRTAGDMMNLRNPDTFGMYTFNDHLAYGALEVVQNLLLDFDEASRELKSWREAWVVTEAMALFMVVGEGGDMCMADDGDMIQETANQIIRMVMSSLAMLDSEGKLAEGSDVKNVGWITGLYLKMAQMLRDMDLLEEPHPTNTKVFKFRNGNFELYLHSYARRCNITIPDVAAPATPTNLTMPKLENRDPWAWTRTFSEYRRGGVPPSYAYRGAHRTNIGGDGLDITTWTSAERKEASFDKKDPLAGTPIKNIKNGLVFVLA